MGLTQIYAFAALSDEELAARAGLTVEEWRRCLDDGGRGWRRNGHRCRQH